MSIMIRCVPVAYSDVAAAAGTSVRITSSGMPDQAWTLTRTSERWVIEQKRTASPDSLIEMDSRDIWLLFTKKLTPATAESKSHIRGDRDLARPFFQSRAIMGWRRVNRVGRIQRMIAPGPGGHLDSLDRG
jgi:hypothetical protein